MDRQANQEVRQLRDKLEDVENNIFYLLNQIDPDRDPYNDLVNEETRLRAELRTWQDEWDSIPPGTVIGWKRTYPSYLSEYTGRAKVIRDNIEGLSSELSRGLPVKRRDIARTRVQTIPTWFSELHRLSNYSSAENMATQATSLWVEDEKIVKTLKTKYGTTIHFLKWKMDLSYDEIAAYFGMLAVFFLFYMNVLTLREITGESTTGNSDKSRKVEEAEKAIAKAKEKALVKVLQKK